MTRHRTAPVVVLASLLVVAVLSAFSRPAGEAPFAEGPVVALGGGPARLARAVAVVGEPSAARPLVLSHGSADRFEEAGGSCDGERVRCIRPEPVSTWGEARAVARLARQEGWPAVTVVTDRSHVPRSRLLFRRCLDVPVRVVAAGDGGRVPLGTAAGEAAAAAVSFAAYHGC